MKYVVIRINDINDIDLTRVSVYDLNNRYVDSKGNLYGLKYNRLQRRVEAIRIVRAGDREAASYQHQILQKRAGARGLMDDDDDLGMPPESIDLAEATDAYRPDALIEETIAHMKTHHERLKGIIMNIRNANILSRDNKSESSEIEEIFRNIEIDVIHGFEVAENYQKELVQYPRSITYYQAKMDTRGREVVDALAGDQKRIMRFIYLYEMLGTIKPVYRTMSDLLKKLNEFMVHKNIDEMKHLNNFERQSFHDAETSIKTTSAEIHQLLDRLKPIEDYLSDPGNF